MKSFLHNKKSFSMSLKRNFYLRLQNRQDKQVRLTFLFFILPIISISNKAFISSIIIFCSKPRNRNSLPYISKRSNKILGSFIKHMVPLSHFFQFYLHPPLFFLTSDLLQPSRYELEKRTSSSFSVKLAHQEQFFAFPKDCCISLVRDLLWLL